MTVDEFEVLDLLTSLVDRSLVTFDEATGRCRLLETVRQYARDRLLESGEGEQWRGRHLEYFVTLGEEAEPHLTGAEQQAWLERLEDEHDNLRAALEWSAGSDPETGLRLATAVWRFWAVRSHFGEGRSRLARLLSAAKPGPSTAARALALNGAGALAHQQVDYTAARVLFEQSLQIRRELGDRRGIAGSLGNLGNVAHGQGDLYAARALFEESLAIFTELGDRWAIAMALDNLGTVALGQDDDAAACVLYEESLVIFRELGDCRGIAGTLGNLGHVACCQGDLPAARSLLGESLAIARELGDRVAIAYSLEELAAALADSRSACLWGAAERLREEVGAPIVPNDRPRYEQMVAAARAARGDNDTFDAAWAEGRAMLLEQAIQLAMEAPN